MVSARAERHHAATAADVSGCVGGVDRVTRQDEPRLVDPRGLPAGLAIGAREPAVSVDDAGRRGRRLTAQAALQDVEPPGFEHGAVALVERPLRSLNTPAAIANSAAHVSAAPLGASPATAATLTAGKVRMMSMAVGTPAAAHRGARSWSRPRRHANSVLRASCATSAAAYTGHCAQANVS